MSADRRTRDEWLLPTLEALLPPESVAQLVALAPESFWETAVRRNMVKDDALLAQLAARFRMRVAELSLVSQQARELVPEQLARKYRVLPLNISDSVLDIATSDPHDLDCERTLAQPEQPPQSCSLRMADGSTSRFDSVAIGRMDGADANGAAIHLLRIKP